MSRHSHGGTSGGLLLDQGEIPRPLGSHARSVPRGLLLAGSTPPPSRWRATAPSGARQRSRSSRVKNVRSVPVHSLNTKQTKLRDSRAAARGTVHDAASSEVKTRYLKNRSVTPETLALYAADRAAFYDWMEDQRLAKGTLKQLDASFEKYLEYLYLDGHGTFKARTVVHAVMFHLDVNWAKTIEFDRTRRAMKDYTKIAKDHSREGCPWAAALLAFTMSTLFGSDGVEGAAALLLAFDTYHRPSEVMRVNRRHLIAPPARARAKSALRAIMVAPSDDAVTKTGLTDDTVIVGEINKERSWLNDIVKELYWTTSPREPDHHRLPPLRRAHRIRFFGSGPGFSRAGAAHPSAWRSIYRRPGGHRPREDPASWALDDQRVYETL